MRRSRKEVFGGKGGANGETGWGLGLDSVVVGVA
jgi:hypothetical protein